MRLRTITLATLWCRRASSPDGKLGITDNCRLNWWHPSTRPTRCWQRLVFVGQPVSQFADWWWSSSYLRKVPVGLSLETNDSLQQFHVKWHFFGFSRVYYLLVLLLVYVLLKFLHLLHLVLFFASSYRPSETSSSCYCFSFHFFFLLMGGPVCFLNTPRDNIRRRQTTATPNRQRYA